MPEAGAQGSLVTPAWLEAHRSDPKVRLIEIAGMGQEQMQAYKAGHIPGSRLLEVEGDAVGYAPTRFSRAGRLCAPARRGRNRQRYHGGILWRRGAVRLLCVVDFQVLRSRQSLHARRRAFRWAEEGRALVTAVPPPATPVQYKPVSRNEGMRIWRDDVLAALGKQDKLILDGRSPEEYSGERVGGPGGRISARCAMAASGRQAFILRRSTDCQQGLQTGKRAQGADWSRVAPRRTRTSSPIAA